MPLLARKPYLQSDLLCVELNEKIFTFYFSGHSPGRVEGPAGCGHSKLARARTGLPLTSVQFIGVTEVVTKSVTKRGNGTFFCEGL